MGPVRHHDDQVAVDVVGRYETLEDDLAAVLDRIGLDVPIDLPAKKSGYRRATGPRRVAFSRPWTSGWPSTSPRRSSSWGTGGRRR
jgi:hypothetical protein